MECRICLETGNFNTMIAPCRCAGTSKWVHRKCIERWIRECDNELAKKKCMECTHEYQYKVLGLLTLFKNFRKIKKTYLELSVIIVFLLFIVIYFLELKDNTPDHIIELNKFIMVILFWMWISFNTIIEIYSWYLAYLDDMFFKFLLDSLSMRFIPMILAIGIIYGMLCYWYISFGLILLYILNLLNLESIIIIGKENQKLPQLLNLTEEDFINP